MIDFSYQSNACDAIIESFENTSYKASVLAACPSSGKTTISHLVINKYLTLYPNARVVVFTEGQNTLKNQYLKELTTPNVPINFTFGGLDSNAQVRVGLPQSINKLQWDKIDLLIVDECHHYYAQKMEQDIIEKLQPNHQLIMTGSPTKFNLHNELYGEEYFIHYIAADELQERGVFSGVDLDVFNISNKKNPEKTIKECLEQAKEKNLDISKLMIACSTIQYATVVSDYLTSIGRKMSLSTSDNDPSDEQIDLFRNNKTDVLVVVCRGILGFNDKNIITLFDLKSSSNVDSSFQLFARILRIHPKEGVVKNYIRVATPERYENEVFTMHKMIALMDSSIFRGFTGSNLSIDFSGVSW